VLSLIIPVYKNEENLERLLKEILKLARQIEEGLEVVFVVDGSPDRSLEILEERLPKLPLTSQLLSLSRNFGSFAAMAAGLAAGKGDSFAVMSADLQEPPELILEFQRLLKTGEADVVFGCRTGRSDARLSEIFSAAFWWVYRRFVVRELPPGGVDVFGCTREVRDHVLRFREVNSSLIVLLFWLGFRRKYVPYQRAPRLEGRSAWNVGKKLRYCIDSIFNFTDLPIQLLFYLGLLGMAVAVIFAPILLIAKLRGMIQVPGYTPIALAILFFGGLSSFGLGVVGQYAWLALQNSRGRPNFIVASTAEPRPSRSEDKTPARPSGSGGP
jgi:glycosyltransferase involved in cell wall biosynthesis